MHHFVLPQRILPCLIFRRLRSRRIPFIALDVRYCSISHHLTMTCLLLIMNLLCNCLFQLPIILIFLKVFDPYLFIELLIHISLFLSRAFRSDGIVFHGLDESLECVKLGLGLHITNFFDLLLVFKLRESAIHGITNSLLNASWPFRNTVTLSVLVYRIWLACALISCTLLLWKIVIDANSWVIHFFRVHLVSFVVDNLIEGFLCQDI